MIQRLPKGTRYYFVNTRMETTSNMDYGNRDIDATKRFECGNYFYTKEECDSLTKLFKTDIEEYHRILNEIRISRNFHNLNNDK